MRFSTKPQIASSCPDSQPLSSAPGGHNGFPFEAPKQKLILFRVKSFPLAQSGILRQYRGLGEQPHHCHHLLLSESHQDLTGLMAMPCIQSASTGRRSSPFDMSFQSHWFLLSFPPNTFPLNQQLEPVSQSSTHFIWA